MLLALAATQYNYEGKLSEEQEAVALAADIVIEAYAVESLLMRVEKMIANRGEDACKAAISMARVYANDASDRAALCARNLASTLTGPQKLFAAFERLSPQYPIDTVRARRNVADAMIEAGRYLW